MAHDDPEPFDIYEENANVFDIGLDCFVEYTEYNETDHGVSKLFKIVVNMLLI